MADDEKSICHARVKCTQRRTEGRRGGGRLIFTANILRDENLYIDTYQFGSIFSSYIIVND